MDKLPLELLHKIFIQLDLQQRLVCLLVCRSWWRVLDTYSLFYDVNLCGDSEKVQILYTANPGKENYGDRFNRMIDMFEHLPARAAQVEELYVKPHPNLRKLLNIFSNARVIKVEPDWRLNDRRHLVGKNLDITHSKSKIEFLADCHSCDLTSQLLYSNLGGRLQTLCLDFNTMSYPNLVSQLKDLPVLKKLSLSRSNISFRILENIHKDIPSIQDFTLKYTRIEPGTLPLDTVPAAAISKFTFSRCLYENSETHTAFYRYITRKYINATDIDFEDEMLRNYAPDLVKQIYLNGVLDFFRSSTRNKAKLAFTSLPRDIDPFEPLDTADTKVQKLDILFCQNDTIFHNLSQSNQYKHVEELTFHNSNVDSIHLIKDMPALATLRILFTSLRPTPANLVDYLTSCPSSLKTISIQCLRMVVNPFEKNLASIENLDIDTSTITSHLGDMISSCFPNLVNLKLRGIVNEDMSITLKNPHFRKFTFVPIPYRGGTFSNHGFTFKSPHMKDAHYFCYKKEITRVPYKKLKKLPMLVVKSLTGKTLQVNEDIRILPY
jgi:hypothetical protein